MAAQFVGLALLLVLSTPAPRDRPRPRGVERRAGRARRERRGVPVRALLALGAARAGGCRRVRGLGDRRRRFPALAAVTAAVALLALVWWQPWARRDPALAARKASSVELRLALWADTLATDPRPPAGRRDGQLRARVPALPGARPAGAARKRWSIRGPHNEYLRFLAEDGVLFCAVAAAPRRAAGGALASLARAHPPASGRWSWPGDPSSPSRPRSSSRWPSRSARWRRRSPSGPPWPRWRRTRRRGRARGAWIAGGTLASVLLLAASLRVATSEYLYVNAPDDVGAQRRACALDPRNLPACVTAAWLELREGDAPAARARLAARARGRAPLSARAEAPRRDRGHGRGPGRSVPAARRVRRALPRPELRPRERGAGVRGRPADGGLPREGDALREQGRRRLAGPAPVGRRAPARRLREVLRRQAQVRVVEVGLHLPADRLEHGRIERNVAVVRDRLFVGARRGRAAATAAATSVPAPAPLTISRSTRCPVASVRKT